MIWILIALGAIGAFLFLVSRKANEFSLERAIVVNASPQAIYPWINNLKNMNQWNPWAGQDARSKIAYEGPEQGPGAVYTWAGGKMGEGRFTIKECQPQDITCQLQMIKPFAADNKVVFSLRPQGAATRVEWHMSGTNKFINKLMQVFISMDKMVGKEFEKGLAGLKEKVESKKLA
jgi:hypothetical protein